MKATMSSILLLLLLVSFSMHVIAGRHLSPRFKDSIIASQTSSKGIMKAKIEETKLKAMKETMVVTPVRNIEEIKKTAPAGASQIQSLVRVSRRMLYAKGIDHPEFHVDYAGPRTHPPSHN